MIGVARQQFIPLLHPPHPQLLLQPHPELQNIISTSFNILYVRLNLVLRQITQKGLNYEINQMEYC